MTERITKPCPACGKLLIIKVRRADGVEFLGCSGWLPDKAGCNYTEELSEAIKLRRQGQKGLFDE